MRYPSSSDKQGIRVVEWVIEWDREIRCRFYFSSKCNSPEMSIVCAIVSVWKKNNIATFTPTLHLMSNTDTNEIAAVFDELLNGIRSGEPMAMLHELLLDAREVCARHRRAGPFADVGGLFTLVAEEGVTTPTEKRPRALVVVVRDPDQFMSAFHAGSLQSWHGIDDTLLARVIEPPGAHWEPVVYRVEGTMSAYELYWRMCLGKAGVLPDEVSAMCQFAGME